MITAVNIHYRIIIMWEHLSGNSGNLSWYWIHIMICCDIGAELALKGLCSTTNVIEYSVPV